MLKTSRGFWKCFLLSFITLGIYGLYYIYKLAQEVNLTCSKYGKDVGGLGFFFLMSIITLGIYSLYWNYRVCEKMSDCVKESGGKPRITGGSWLLWEIVGAIIIVGPIVANVKQIHIWNDVNAIYNQRHPELAIENKK